MRHFSQSPNRPLFPSLFPPVQRSPSHGLSTTPSITIRNVLTPIASGFDSAIAIIPGLKPRGYSLSSLRDFGRALSNILRRFSHCPNHSLILSSIHSPFANAAKQHFRGYKAEHCNQINHPFSHSHFPSTSTLFLPFTNLFIYSITHSLALPFTRRLQPEIPPKSVSQPKQSRQGWQNVGPRISVGLQVTNPCRVPSGMKLQG